MKFQNIVLIGGGVLGSQIAYQTAYAGFHTTVYLRSGPSPKWRGCTRSTAPS